MAETATPFADNWAYLKTELAWLDRLLLLAVSRQQQEHKAIERVARSSGDRVGQHWWKGILTLPHTNRYHECPTPKPPYSTRKYGQQLQARICASQARGICLALPHLQAQLQLSSFEKNVILMALAPEVNQRFGRLYSYLQAPELPTTPELPTVALCLRLLCRDDQAWRQARPQLAPTAPLFQTGCLQWSTQSTEALLGRQVKLADDLVTYLLADAPNVSGVPFLTRAMATATAPLQTASGVDWSQLILPPATLKQLQTLAQISHHGPGQIALLIGETGTGKLMTARALAQHWGTSVTWLDLAAQPQAPLPDLTEAVLLVKSAQHWLGRRTRVSEAELRQWLQRRRQRPGLTLLTLHPWQTIRPRWRSQIDAVITLPRPDQRARHRLWQQALPADSAVEADLDWAQVARDLPLTGGQIQTLARQALALAGSAPLTRDHLQQALALQHPTLTLKSSRWS
ncbi:hypothetical protein XM38_041340 [Halomicronema hongdechloris C2206]|uniref:Winged helix domain-containing protein n=1 Tax=Halomicronema hongdechloris C2206 TaxID=1641165 RepID=A0A1Z3HSD7_9CYAN|nr:hypothetical protein [Halomicronema hongdechloris]ASC73172.1 hypothetical protein XM38_041340 [Halomicronema hongdechloris C2206]